MSRTCPSGLRIAFLAPVILFWASIASATSIQQAFLVQNSGWMEPFYTDPSSPFKPLIAAVAGAVTTPQDTVHLLAFNQSSGSHVSPQLLSKSAGAADFARVLAPLTIARKSPGGALADTDFKEAVSSTITGPFGAAPGILWVFTNNRNSPNNDPQTAERNREFYQLLHLEPSITKTLVFPLRMPVRGSLFSATGLMVYALAYGQPAAQALDRIIAEGRLSQVLTNAPARLKPVDQDAVRLVPQSVKNSANIRVGLASDQRTLVLDVMAGELVPTVTLQASLENLFFPYVISNASVAANLLTGAGRLPIQASPSTIQNLQPGAKQPIEVTLTLPMAQVPSPWSVQAISAMGKQLQIPLMVEISMSGQRLVPSSEFIGQLKELFPGDPISEVFTPPESVRASQTQVPLIVRIQYPLAPVVALLGAVILLLGSLVAFMLFARTGRRYDVMVDDVRHSYLLKPFATLLVQDGNGLAVGKLKRRLGRPQVLSVSDGHSLSVVRR